MLGAGEGECDSVREGEREAERQRERQKEGGGRVREREGGRGRERGEGRAETRPLENKQGVKFQRLGTQAFHCSSQLSVENNNNRWIQSGQLVPDRPGAAEQMMKCEIRAGRRGCPSAPLLHTPDVNFHKDS